jgi:hypothetical protein
MPQSIRADGHSLISAEKTYTSTQIGKSVSFERPGLVGLRFDTLKPRYELPDWEPRSRYPPDDCQHRDEDRWHHAAMAIGRIRIFNAQHFPVMDSKETPNKDQAKSFITL